MAVQYLISFLLALTASAAVRLTSAQSCGGVTFAVVGNGNSLCFGTQDITCTVSGMVAASMQWQLLVSDVPTPFKRSTGMNNVTMQLSCSTSARFRCRADDSSENVCTKDIEISPKELEHSVTITPTINGTVLAGTTLTLTCEAVIDRVPTLKWIDPNGQPVQSGNGIIVSQQDNLNTLSIVNLTFNGVRTSQSGNYSCSCELQQPHSLAEDEYCLVVKIPSPKVKVGRSPDASVELFTTTSLTLSCTYPRNAAVDTSTSTTVTWTGSPSLSDSPRVTHVGSSVEFSSLKSSDSANYICCVQLISGTPKVINSDKICDSIAISITLQMLCDIQYNSTLDCYDNPPFYQPGTSITLSCVAQQASGTVTYNWISTGSESFVNGATTSSVSNTMLSSADNGTHTCTATDDVGNIGSFSTVMIIKGIGMHMLHSEYISGQFLPNNSIVLPKSKPCLNCRLNFFCFSDAPTGTAGVTYPDGSIKHVIGNHFNTVVKQQSGATGINVYNYKSYKPLLYGVYTCVLPGLSGATLHHSVSVHTNLPGRPRVYSAGYSDLVEVFETEALMEITCSTSDSPPTTVQCSCDGELIDFCGDDFDLVQVVTNRRNVYYDNIIVVKDVTKVAGKHVYRCNISNSRGSDTCEVETNIPVYDSSAECNKTGSIEKGERAILQCSVQLRGKLSVLLPYIKLEWQGPPGVSMTKSNGFIIGQQQFSSQGSSLDLELYPLGTQHRGVFMCNSAIAVPSLIPFFLSTGRCKPTVQYDSYFQLKFGPVNHCSKWHNFEGYVEHIECDIKTSLESAINSRCQCGFKASAIDQGEFSCRYTGQDVIYRARITGTVYTSSELLQMVDDWITTEHSFLSTYDGQVRLWFDPTAPLHIPSLFEPEPTPIQDN